MNFLSHYYLDRFHPSPYYKLGTILPDLVRVSNKKVRLQFAAHDANQYSPESNLVMEGTEKHFLADAHFHNSDFFREHASALKRTFIRNGLQRKEIRLFFLSHILTEMLLDRQILLEDISVGHSFYADLREAEQSHILHVLRGFPLFNENDFSKHFSRFLESKYLLEYVHTEAIFYAVNRVSERIGLHAMPQTDFKMFEKSIGEEQERLALSWKKYFDQAKTMDLVKAKHERKN